MQKIKEFYARIVSYDAEPVQLMLATLWLIYGFLLVCFQIPFVEKTRLTLDFLGHPVHGVLLVVFGALGWAGVYYKNLLLNLSFSIFTVFNNAMMLIAILMTFQSSFHSGWVNEFVQLLAAILLLNRYTHQYFNKSLI